MSTKNTTVSNWDIREVGNALTKVRGQLDINNEQLFKALAQVIPNYVDIPRDRRTAEFKKVRSLLDDAVAAIEQLSTVLH